ncbi:MAG: YceI family protein [Solirubrobacteraceae bacterium]
MSATSIPAERIPAGVYNVDPAHSNVGFEVRHMGIATVRGTFRGFEGTIDASGEARELTGTVDIATIDTGEENRDGHLKGPEFFDADQHPKISFHSTGTGDAGDGKVSLTGEITIKGISKPIELTGTIGENGEDPWGNERIGLELEGVIDRRDFDLKWNQTLPNGNLLVANEVKLLVSVSAVKSA